MSEETLSKYLNVYFRDLFGFWIDCSEKLVLKFSVPATQFDLK